MVGIVVAQASSGGVLTRAALILTGGPAVGKSVTAHGVAAGRARCAVIDVDDVRQFVVTGAAAPWAGEEGRRQQGLGVRNACSLARNFLAAGIEVVIADVLTPQTSNLYRQELPGCLIVHLVVGLPEAVRRAATRKVWLTDAEFRMLHESDASNPPAADHRIQVDTLDLHQQTETVARVWGTRR